MLEDSSRWHNNYHFSILISSITGLFLIFPRDISNLHKLFATFFCWLFEPLTAHRPNLHCSAPRKVRKLLFRFDLKQKINIFSNFRWIKNSLKLSEWKRWLNVCVMKIISLSEFSVALILIFFGRGECIWSMDYGRVTCRFIIWFNL